MISFMLHRLNPKRQHLRFQFGWAPEPVRMLWIEENLLLLQGFALRIVPPTRKEKKGILTVFAFTIPNNIKI
jgi:hypothetical protein